MKAPSYVRVRYAGRSVILRDPVEAKMLGTPCLIGIEVDSNGDEVAPKGFDQRRRAIAVALVTRRTRLEFSKKYGVLVSNGGAK